MTRPFPVPVKFRDLYYDLGLSLCVLHFVIILDSKICYMEKSNIGGLNVHQVTAIVYIKAVS